MLCAVLCAVHTTLYVVLVLAESPRGTLLGRQSQEWSGVSHMLVG